MMEFCDPVLARHSRLNHAELRKLDSDGRCPICDPSVARSEYCAIVSRVLSDPELRARVTR